jgi:hypothetical protein
VAVSTADNPAAPFVFILTQRESRLGDYGEGTGDPEASEAAASDLRDLSAVEIAALRAGAESASAKPVPSPSPN